MRYFILFSIITLNGFLVFLALSPGIVTYAEIIPQAVQCSLCDNVEVQKALLKAASSGRAQITSLIQNNSIIILAACISNCILVALLLFSSKWLFSKNQ